MAARKNPFHNFEAREKIRTSQLLNRLQYFALDEPDPSTGKVPELTLNHLNAIGKLLDKALPNLQAIEASGPEGGPIEHTITTNEQLLSRIAGIAARAGTPESNP